MKIFKKLLTVALVISLYSYLLFAFNTFDSKVGAYSTSCPPGMTDQQCLIYLQQQSANLQKEKSSISSKLSAEQYNQLSLQQKISYLNGQIKDTQNQINDLEIQIETNNVKVRILNADITDKENSVNTLAQEVQTLDSSMKKRISLSYQYSFITPIEIILENNNFDTLLRRLKYLAESRKKDKDLLAQMAETKGKLQNEKDELESKKAQVDQKLTEIEAQKTELFAQKTSLDKQKSERSGLLAISQQKESDYQKSLANLKKQEDIITAKISQLIFNLFQSGQLPANTPVNRGDIIGFEGHSGLAYGAHLHFELRKNGSIINPYAGGYFTWPNGNGSKKFPMSGASITQFPHSNSYAIDMVSMSMGNQSGDKYYTNGVHCSYGSVPAGYYNMRGEGAPLYAIADGKVSNVFTDVCGGRAVIVDYGGGLTALYLHLR
ncbi:MAG TPA: hypothetical protein VHA74_01595 [Candidatus Dojkabacteria bacterium]|nr:hypothetical protein [Candidatus Dojkabacteria bacterium]